MKITELLETLHEQQLITTTVDMTMSALAKLFVEHSTSAALVVDDSGNMEGIITERDIVKTLVENPERLTNGNVGSAMTANLITCTTDDSVVEIFSIMNKGKFRHIPVLIDNKPFRILSIQDFHQACRHMHLLSLTDELTRLPNRRYFYERLQFEIGRSNTRGVPLSVAIADLDKFKLVNDTYGHNAGDKVLHEIACLLSGALRNDDMVARLGGEEFGFIFPNTDLENAHNVCENLRRVIEEHKTVFGAVKIKSTSSFGVLQMDGDINSNNVLHRVDMLMYKAKASGRNRVFSDLVTTDMSEAMSA